MFSQDVIICFLFFKAFGTRDTWKPSVVWTVWVYVITSCYFSTVLYVLGWEWFVLCLIFFLSSHEKTQTKNLLVWLLILFDSSGPSSKLNWRWKSIKCTWFHFQKRLIASLGLFMGSVGGEKYIKSIIF